MGGVDAILLDLTLPDSAGLATFEALFAVASHTPIMTLGALSSCFAM
jgi:DNA-binding response OmpR family regulator